VSGNGTIGVLALYLLFAWLVSAAAGAWLTDRKGYGEKAGLMLGLILTVAGLLVALLLPARPNSAWRRDGPLPRRRRVIDS
jgi:fucose permease